MNSGELVRQRRLINRRIREVLLTRRLAAEARPVAEVDDERAVPVEA